MFFRDVWMFPGRYLSSSPLFYGGGLWELAPGFNPQPPAITQQISLPYQVRTEHSVSLARSAACVARPHNFAL